MCCTATRRSRVRSAFRHVVHIHVPLSPTSVPGSGQRAVMPYDYGKVTEGLASHWPCITDKRFIHLRAEWHCTGQEYPVYSPQGAWSALLLFFNKQAEAAEW